MSNELIIKIEGMTCSGCSAGIKRKLERIDFVSDIDIEIKTSEARINILNRDDEKDMKILNEVARMGYVSKIQN